MYIEKPAYTHYNAEFRQESDGELQNRCHHRTFFRYDAISYSGVRCSLEGYTKQTTQGTQNSAARARPELKSGWAIAHSTGYCPYKPGDEDPTSTRVLCTFGLQVMF